MVLAQRLLVRPCVRVAFQLHGFGNGPLFILLGFNGVEAPLLDQVVVGLAVAPRRRLDGILESPSLCFRV